MTDKTTQPPSCSSRPTAMPEATTSSTGPTWRRTTWRSSTPGGPILEPVQGPLGRDPGPELGRRAQDLRAGDRRRGGRGPFPNTIPPFFPTGAVSPVLRGRRTTSCGSPAPSPQPMAGRLVRPPPGPSGRHRADLPQRPRRRHRRCPVVSRARARGGVLVHPVPDDMTHLKPLYAPDYDPLWAVCQSSAWS